MSIWAKLLASAAILVLLAGTLAFWMDLYGVRRGCLAARPDQAQFQLAADLYAKANTAISARNYMAANDMLDMALFRLGDSYRLGRAEDDTGELVAAGKAALARGEFEIAARLKQEAVNRRVSLFQRKTRLSGLCHQVFGRWQ